MFIEGILNQCSDKELVYQERFHCGLIRYLQLSVERSSGRVQCAFVVNGCEGMEGAAAKALLDGIQDHPELFHSLWWNYNDRKTNTIFGPYWKRAWGEEYIWMKICGIDIPIHPGHFMQANPACFEKLVAALQSEVSSSESIVELYAGMGVLSLCLKDRIRRSFCVEVNPASQAAFLEAQRRNSSSEKIRFVVGDSEMVYQSLDIGQHTLIVDPPRKGLGAHLLREIERKRSQGELKKLVYISCHYPSLERDVGALFASGGWAVQKARAFLFFPGTEHIETLVVLESV